jgi:hypothetical protein
VHGQELGSVEDLVAGDDECETLGFDTDTGAVRCGGVYGDVYTGRVPFLVYRQSGAPTPADTVGVFILRSLRMHEDARVVIFGSRPAILVLQDSLLLESGSVEVTAGGWPGPSWLDGPARGNGPGGGGFVTYREVGNHTSGAGGSFCSEGGLGASTAADQVGALYGNAEISPLLGGSSGGTSGANGSGDGGDGGGALQVVAGSRIEIQSAATIEVRGGGGSADTIYPEGSGGGSGGAILLEAPEVSVGGLLDAGGGWGGGSGVGGRGASGTTGAGRGTSTISPQRTGGGGGGFGRIRINTEAGDVDIRLDAVISPARSHECMTTGILLPRTDPEPPPTCPGVDLSATTCGVCTEQMCCSEYLACDRSELCALCRDSATPGPACSTESLLARLEDCQERLCPVRCR